MIPEIFIETPRLILRQWKETDHEPFVKLNMDNDIMEFFPSVLTKAETMVQIERLSSHIDRFGYGFFAVERKDNQQFIGFTGLSHPRFESYFTPCVEIGWRLSKANWGRGFATEAAKACLEYGLNDLGIGETWSFTSVYNVRSEKVMQKIGMIKQDYFEHPLIEDGHILKQKIYTFIKKNQRISCIYLSDLDFHF